MEQTVKTSLNPKGGDQPKQPSTLSREEYKTWLRREGLSSEMDLHTIPLTQKGPPP